MTLPLLGSGHALLTERQSAVLERLRPGGAPMRVGDLAEAPGVSPRTVQNDLVTLESLGLVFRLGRGKAVRWTKVR